MSETNSKNYPTGEYQNPAHDEPTQPFKAACLNEAIDNYIQTPIDKNLAEVRFYQEEEHSKREANRKLKEHLLDLLTQTEMTYLANQINKFKP